MQIRIIALPAERRQSESALKVGRAKTERLVPRSPAAYERECALGSLKGRRREPFKKSMLFIAGFFVIVNDGIANVFLIVVFSRYHHELTEDIALQNRYTIND